MSLYEQYRDCLRKPGDDGSLTPVARSKQVTTATRTRSVSLDEWRKYVVEKIPEWLIELDMRQRTLDEWCPDMEGA